MNEKDLLKKLNNLKKIKPDENWKKNYREVLYSQISAGQNSEKPESKIRFIFEEVILGKIFISFTRPIWATTLASILILVVGVGGVYASKNSKPGDSLYIAKIISEKAQLAMTFDEKGKAKLGLEFATNRAKEITQVLEEQNYPEDQKTQKVEQLTQNFKKEISQVKSRLSNIKTSVNQEEDLEVSGANLEKDNQRMELSEQPKVQISQEIFLPVEPVAAATTTIDNLKTPDKVLEEAEKMFDEKNYDGSINKIEEVKQIINDNTEGQVKGVSETATSTQ